MNVLILGGQSPRHKAWVRDVDAALKPYFDRLKFLDYRHWDDESLEPDLEYEVNCAAELAKDLGEYVVVAKSIGTVITSLAIARARLAPQKCLFLGFPLTVVERSLPGVADGITDLPETIFVQNEDDPLGSSSAVKAYVEANPPLKYSFEALPGDTHDYVDFELIARLAT